MRFIHTADWHLGRLFHGVHLTNDQAYVLEQFIDLVADVRPAAVLLAGDVYDRGVPPTEAVQLLDDVLSRIVDGLGVPVVAIAGNHDSPDRLGFGARLLVERGLHLAGRVSAVPVAAAFEDSAGGVPVFVSAIPFADPVDTRHALADDSIHDHEAAMAALVAGARERAPAAARHVLVAHAFVAGATESDSERAFAVGGAGQVPASVFEGFDYVALGHLHRPQTAGAETVRYSGSLMRYSFKEADQPKSVTIVEVDTARPQVIPTFEQVALAPRRDVRVVEGTLHDLLAAAPADPAGDDYICARLLDKGAILDPLGQVRAAYPNVLSVERPALDIDPDRPITLVDPRARPESEHFAEFFEYCTDDPLDGREREAFVAVLESIEKDRREA